MPDGFDYLEKVVPPSSGTNKLATTSYVDMAIRGGVPRHGDGATETGVQVSFPFRITAATSVETGRWKYTGTLQIRQRSAAGAASYADDDSGFSTTELWNDAEEKNLSGYTVGGSAAYGNGVVKSELASGFAVKHIPVGMVVFARPEYVVSAGEIVTEWVFSCPNGVSGACP